MSTQDIERSEMLEGRLALEAVKMLTGSANAPHLLIRGSSMSPLLRSPMVLKLAPSADNNRLGDIVVFERGGQLIAHRITSLRGGVLQTCGDAQPWAPEYPDRSTVVGKVTEVLASESPDAPRIDTQLFWLRGRAKAYFRSVRATPFHARRVTGRVLGALPWLRQRPYVALVQAMAASIRDDKRALDRSLRISSASALCATARRHGCSATLLDAVTSMGNTSSAGAYIKRSLQPVGRDTVLIGLAVREQTKPIINALNQAEVPFALLKGAARLYRAQAEDALHASSDIDILVKSTDLEAATAALRALGYYEKGDPQTRERYERHHHAPPLFPAAGGCAVELHVSLAPPGQFSLPLNWDALRPFMVSVDGPAGKVLCLGGVGAALHLAVHATGYTFGLYRLRDSVLLARLLRSLSKEELEKLRSLVRAEQIDPVRLEAAVVLAARMASVPWSVRPEVEEYLRWCMRREDTPLYFGQRSQLAEGWYAGGCRFSPIMWRLLDPHGSQRQPSDKPEVGRMLGRGFTSVCAYLYTLAMRPPKTEK